MNVALDASLVRRALDEMVRRIPDPDRVLVIFSGEYAQTVDELRPSAQPYEAARGTIEALAITFAEDDGTSTVVTNGLYWIQQDLIDALLRQLGEQPADVSVAEELDLVRLLVHESLHVALNQRGEGRFVRGVPDQYFEQLAAVSAEEFRIERALCREGWWPPIDYLKATYDDLVAVDTELDRVRRRTWDRESNDTVLTTIVRDLPNAVLQLGYGLADLAESPDDRVHLESQTPLWAKVFGKTWDEIVKSYTALPSATVELVNTEANRLLTRLAETLDAWLRMYGLTVFHDGGQTIRFHLEV